MQVLNPKIDQTLARADKAPFASPMGGAPASAPSDSTEYDDHLTMLVGYFEEAEDMTRRSRELSERDRDFHDNYDDSQWTEKEKAMLRKRGQPITTSNYIKRKVATLKGGEMRMRSDPKAFPRNPDDEQTAGAATDALRFVGDQNKFNVIRSKVYENFLIEGYGGADVVIEDVQGEKRVKIMRVAWDRLFYDPHSSAEDFSDAKYKGVVIWRDAEKGDQDVLGETLRTYGTQTYDDKPGTAWVDSKRKRVRVVQIHYLYKDQWMIATFTKAGFIEKPVVSPYKDRYGKSACSLIIRSAYVDRKNNRYGSARDWISTQEEINKRRSKMLHLLSVRQTYGNKQGIQDAAKAKQELAKPDGHVEINGGAKFGEDFGILPTGDMHAGHSELLHLAINEMQASGPNAAMAGKAPGQQSGRALEAQMQAGSVEMEPLVDELRQWTRDIYEAAWMRVRQFWTDETWVRVTDDDRNIKFVGLNKKVTVADKIAQMPEEMRAMWMQQKQIQPNDPRLQQVIEVQNEVSGLDVDIEIEEGPDISTLQSEQFETLASLAKNGLPIPADAIVEASSLRNKDAILKKMRGDEEQQNPALMQAKQHIDQMGQQMQQMQQALEQMKQAAAKAQTDLQATKLDRQAEIEKTQLEWYKAETDRIKAEESVDISRAQQAFQEAEAERQAMLQFQQAQQPVPEQQEPNEPAQSVQGPDTSAVLAQALQGHAAALHGFGQALGNMNQPRQAQVTINKQPDGSFVGNRTEM